jgi:glycosyltransferase involved in cell wall biosynthesis
MPEVSVVIPSYNHARFVRQAVQSVISQTLPDHEIIVVDDGSNDNSLEILASISDKRLKILSQENQGAHAAINRGLREARGEFLAILNSDDYYHPQRLEKTIPALKASPSVGLVSSYIQIIDDKDHLLGIKHGHKDCEPWLLEHPERSFRAGDDLKEVLLTENFLATTSNYVFSRQWLERVGDFRPLRFTHDWDFALRMTKSADLVLLPEPLLSYRVHSENTIRQDQAAMIFEICWILAMHLPDRIFNTGSGSHSASEEKIDRLLNSIYTFNCEKILSVMLLNKLHEDPDMAMRLIEPGNPVREKYLEYIQRSIQRRERDGIQSALDNPPGLVTRGESAIRKFLRRMAKPRSL